jgi:hypothetical protein
VAFRSGATWRSEVELRGFSEWRYVALRGAAEWSYVAFRSGATWHSGVAP